MSANDYQVGGEHYRSAEGEQLWDRIWRLYGHGWFAGNIMAYVERYKSKNGVEDLKKAKHFLEKLIELEEGAKGATAPETPPGKEEEGDACPSWTGHPRCPKCGKEALYSDFKTLPGWVYQVCEGCYHTEFSKKADATEDIPIDATCPRCNLPCRSGEMRPTFPWGSKVCGGCHAAMEEEGKAGVEVRDDPEADMVQEGGYKPLLGRVRSGAPDPVPETLEAAKKRWRDRMTRPVVEVAKERTSACCECGEEYPWADMERDHQVYCPKCRYGKQDGTHVWGRDLCCGCGVKPLSAKAYLPCPHPYKFLDKPRTAQVECSECKADLTGKHCYWAGKTPICNTCFHRLPIVDVLGVTHGKVPQRFYCKNCKMVRGATGTTMLCGIEPPFHAWETVESAGVTGGEVGAPGAKRNKLGHRTRYSDSSLYDEVCEDCGATDGRGDEGLKKPCPKSEPPSPAWEAPQVLTCRNCGTVAGGGNLTHQCPGVDYPCLHMFVKSPPSPPGKVGGGCGKECSCVRCQVEGK